ncbi:MAG TPA: hypothetical protein VI454_10545 [Verrucomicrobiae bacterium]|jgi:hypothetical protein
MKQPPIPPARTWGLVAALSALASTLIGCVGYNHTLFMTKSNAGLDFDAKPPTLEVNISRKEGVVAPAFEGGRTPPVMASFGAKAGSGGGLGRFFFGVDQTFAGGDAAVTMAKLYDTNGVPLDDIPASNRFDSALRLTKLPKANQPGKGAIRRFLFGLPEPGEVKPFVFGTDTQLGVKVGWTGVGGPYPETIKIGFNRKEIAVAPVTLIKGTDNDPTSPHRVQMPSFLATVDTDVNAGGDVQIAWMQYFATGEAANHLARQPAVREAMIKRADAGQEAARKELEAKETKARADVAAHQDKVSAILAKVAPSGTVQEQALKDISDGVTTLKPNRDQWVNDFKGKAGGALRDNLQGFNANAVDSLFKKINP